MITKHTPTVQIGSHFYEYYIVFDDSHTLPWWVNIFTRKGFRHCGVYMACEGGTIGIEHSWFGTNFYTWPAPIELIAQHFADQGKTVLYLPTVRIEKAKKRLGCFAPTCVGICMNITGLTFHTFTPYSYYRKLLRHGHRIGASHEYGQKAEG